MDATREGGPLAGIRVLDFCHFLAGPYAALALADLGADVIKVEDPDHLDEARSIGPCFQDGQSLYFAALNWGKRSFAAKLAHPDGRAAVLELVRTADVVIDNYRPGVTTKLGVDHDALAAVNPMIVSCSLTGFGETGPYATRPGYDYTIQALAGVMSQTGDPDAPPGKAGISYVDHSGGLAAAFGICAALLERVRTGRGRHIDLGLFDVQVSMLSYLASWELNAGFTPARQANGSHPSIVPAQTFATNDGYISIFVGNDPMWQRLVGATDDQRLSDPRFTTAADRSSQRAVLLPLLSDVFLTAPTASWVSRLAECNVPCAPVNDVRDALSDPQTTARSLIGTAHRSALREYRHARGPIPVLGTHSEAGPPVVGQDTQPLMQELGYTDDQVARLKDEGVIVLPVP